MPVHACTTELAVLERLLKVIESKERVVAVVPQGTGAVLIFTESKPRRTTPARETR